MIPFSKHLQLDDSKGSDELQEPTPPWTSIRFGYLQLLFFSDLIFIPSPVCNNHCSLESCFGFASKMTVTVQGSMKRLLWNTYQQSQALPQSFPFSAPPVGCLWEVTPLAIFEVFCSKLVIFNIRNFMVLPFLHDPRRTAVITSKETLPLFLFLFPSFLDGYTTKNNKW